MNLVNDWRYFVLVLHTELHSNPTVSVGSAADRNLCKLLGKVGLWLSFRQILRNSLSLGKCSETLSAKNFFNA